MSNSTAAETYDLLPYMNQPYAQTHPDRLATVATLFGLEPPRADRCRLLELGCAGGGNLIPMAVELPESRFVGVEHSARQTAAARELIADTGLSNVEIRQASILDIDDGYGRFDFIVSHGVYSWVPENVRHKLLDVYRRQLAPGGVGYISYNTLPGWHMRGMVRDMMCYHLERAGPAPPATQVARARGLLDFLAQSVEGDNEPYALLLRRELEVLGKKADAYLFHDHLETDNDAFYFHQFCRHLAQNELRYLGEANISSMGAFSLAPRVRAVLARMAPNQIDLEQYLDFLRNRTFRQTLVCHRGQQPAYLIEPARVFGLCAGCPLKPASAPSPPTPLPPPIVAGHDVIASRAEGEGSMVFTGPEGARVETAEPIAKAALLCLAEAWPQTLAFAELCRRARGRLGPVSQAEPALAQQDREAVSKLLVQGYVGGPSKVIELRQCPERFVTRVSSRPEASVLARWQAGRGEPITNLRHEVQPVSDFARKLLPLLDGSRDRAELLQSLCDFVARGEMKVEVEGGRVTDPMSARDILRWPLEQELTRMARSALLTS